jgi:hypothetical protein
MTSNQNTLFRRALALEIEYNQLNANRPATVWNELYERMEFARAEYQRSIGAA